MSDRIDLKKLCEEVEGKFDEEHNVCVIDFKKYAPRFPPLSRWYRDLMPAGAAITKEEVSSRYILINAKDMSIKQYNKLIDAIKDTLSKSILDRGALIIDTKNKEIVRVKLLSDREWLSVHFKKAIEKVTA